MNIALRYAARSDIGLGRYSNNQDSGYAGPHLLVIADGMGGHAAGDVASSTAIARLVALDDAAAGGGDALERLTQALTDANQDLRDRVAAEPSLHGMGTTVTAILYSGNKLALAHIGDSRGYLLRDGQLTQITHDHTFVQTPRRRGPADRGGGAKPPAAQPDHPGPDRRARRHPDLSVRDAKPGDTYLLCSDGLTGVVTRGDPGRGARRRRRRRGPGRAADRPGPQGRRVGQRHLHRRRRHRPRQRGRPVDLARGRRRGCGPRGHDLLGGRLTGRQGRRAGPVGARRRRGRRRIDGRGRHEPTSRKRRVRPDAGAAGPGHRPGRRRWLRGVRLEPAAVLRRHAGRQRRDLQGPAAGRRAGAPVQPLRAPGPPGRAAAVVLARPGAATDHGAGPDQGPGGRRQPAPAGRAVRDADDRARTSTPTATPSRRPPATTATGHDQTATSTPDHQTSPRRTSPTHDHATSPTDSGCGAG